MGHYNFRQDLVEAHVTEDEVAARILRRVPGSRLLDKNNDHLYDLAMVIRDIPVYIEVKDDKMSEQTGNIALEYKSRGKPSDISTTAAECWVFKYRRRHSSVAHFRLVQTARLKEAMIQGFAGEYRQVVGGDPGSETKMFLIPVTEFETWGVRL